MARAILITGTTRGIGRALAEHYLELGWMVGGCARQASAIEHERYRHYVTDLADESAIVTMVRDFARQQGRLDALINNAGIASMNHILTTPGETAQRLMTINFAAALCAMREAAKLMQRQKRGRIVNLTTVAVPLNLEGEAVYAASKAALESLTRTAAHELAPMGITVNAVGPAPIETDLTRAVPKAKIEKLLQRQAIQRFGSVNDVCHVADFFLSEDSDFVTGQVIYLGGVT